MRFRWFENCDFFFFRLLPPTILLVLLQASTPVAEVPARLADFLYNRNDIAAEFADQVEKCVIRHDTDHPAFHGCVDWHSAVHGVWALTAYTRITGDRTYVPLIDSTLNVDLLDAERAYLSEFLYFEMPYGRAWFLRLALEHMRTFNSDLLTEFADEIANSLADYYTENPPNPSSREYQNTSWALLNLYDYATHRRNSKLSSFVENIVKALYLPKDGKECPVLTEESSWPDFMAVSTNWAMLVSRAGRIENFKKWVDLFLPPGRDPVPVTNPLNPHHFGLNFSRAWGFWALYESTGDLRFLDLFLDHFYQNYSHHEWWEGDYRSVGHWVAQFGMFAVVETYMQMKYSTGYHR